MLFFFRQVSVDTTGVQLPQSRNVRVVLRCNICNFFSLSRFKDSQKLRNAFAFHCCYYYALMSFRCRRVRRPRETGRTVR